MRISHPSSALNPKPQTHDAQTLKIQKNVEHLTVLLVLFFLGGGERGGGGWVVWWCVEGGVEP